MCSFVEIKFSLFSLCFLCLCYLCLCFSFCEVWTLATNRHYRLFRPMPDFLMRRVSCYNDVTSYSVFPKSLRYVCCLWFYYLQRGMYHSAWLIVCCLKFGTFCPNICRLWILRGKMKCTIWSLKTCLHFLGVFIGWCFDHRRKVNRNGVKKTKGRFILSQYNL
jgi:hypothetical protein